jgi:hypothetical protein
MESVYPSTKRSPLQLLAGYLERARQFEFLAGETKDDPRFKRVLLRQVVAYRMLAVKRADKLHLPIPPLTALPTDAQKDRRRRLRNALPIEKEVMEPVFGQIKQARGFRQFLLRGVEKVRAEWVHDLHHPQSPETFHPRKGRLRRLPCNKCLAAMPIWTGS